MNDREMNDREMIDALEAIHREAAAATPDSTLRGRLLMIPGATAQGEVILVRLLVLTRTQR